MARPQVTITLGRSGQKVVKRPMEGFDGFRQDAPALSGSKRYAEDAADSFSFSGKRLQVSVSVNNSGSEYSRRSSFGENDLRQKLLRKRMAKQMELDKAQQKKQKISRSFQSSEAPGRFHSRNEFDSLARRAGESSSQGPGSILSRNEYESLARRAAESPQMESARTSYSSSTIDTLRSRSQAGAMQISRGMTSSRPMGHMSQPSPSMQPVLCRTGVFQVSYPADPRPVTFTSTRSGLTTSNPRRESIAVGSSITKAPYLEEHFTVSSLLNALGLGKYAIIFQAEEVDMHALKQMGDRDLKEIGIPMGPRKKIMLAMMAQAKRQAT